MNKGPARSPFVEDRIAHALLMTAGLILLHIGAFHFGGIYGLLLLEGLILRSKV